MTPRDNSASERDELMGFRRKLEDEDEILSIVRNMNDWRTKRLVEYNIYSTQRLASQNDRPIYWRNLFDELFARAFAQDQYCVTKACPGKPIEIDKALVRIVKTYRQGLPLCNADPERALDLFRRLFEIYSKALQMVSSLMNIIDGKEPVEVRTRNDSVKTIPRFDVGRFEPLILEPSKTIMRNAIAHETVFPDTERCEISFDSKDRTVRMTYEEVDDSIKEVHQRVMAFFESKQMFEIYSGKSHEVSMISAKEEMVRLAKELVKQGVFDVTENGDIVPAGNPEDDAPHNKDDSSPRNK